MSTRLVNTNFTFATLVVSGKIVNKAIIIETKDSSFVFNKEFGLIPTDLKVSDFKLVRVA